MKRAEKRGAKSLLRDRKAQITVFMIVGIILLFSSALLFYIRGQIVAGIPEEFIPTIEEVPLEAQPIKVFVEDCMRRVGTEAIRKMSIHGGYIDPSDMTYGSVFSAGIEPTESEALVMMEGSSAMVPYWWHMSSPNDCREDCKFDDNRPALYKRVGGERSIEGQIDRYIERNLARCLDDFRAFRDIGFDIEVRGNIEPDFKVAEKEALVLVKYPIRVSKEGRDIDIERFFTKIDANVKEVYELATDIVNSELALSFLEKHTMNLIAMYSKPVSMGRIPPMGYFSFDQGEYLVWTTTETKQRMQSYVLPPGISLLQIIGTANYQRHVIFDIEEKKYDRISTGIMDKTQVTLNSSKFYTDIEARVTYLDWWPIYLNINDAEILKPQEIGPAFTGILFDLLGMKRYSFGYDLSFPVLVTVTDPFAFGGTGLKFSFAMEANLRNNMVMNSSFTMLPRSPSPSYFCDPNQFNSGLISLEVEEMYTGEPVPDAKVDFIAADEICFVGFAEMDGQNRSSLSANFPIGSGEIKISKEGYIPIRKPFAALLDVSSNHTFRMMPFYSINATIVLVPLSYHEGRYVLPKGIPTASLSPKESAIMSFKRMDNDDFGEYESYLMYNITKGPSVLLIVPGIYEVEAYIMLHDRVILPKEHKTFDIPFGDDQDVEINESVFDLWNSGGAVFSNETSYLEITRDDLLGSRMVRFKVLRFPLPITHSRDIGMGPDLEQLSEHDLYSSIYMHELQPDWVR